jgi:hypothetical protein
MKMSKLKTNQSGFTSIEIVLVIIVLLVLGGAGWYVLNHKKDKPVANSPTTTSTKAADKPKVTETTVAPQTFVDKFLKDYKANDKAAVNSVVTSVLAAKIGGADFYTGCSSDEACNTVLKMIELGTTTPVVTDYTAKSGDKGKQLVYTVTTTVDGAKSVNKYTFDLVSNGNSWKLDDYGVDFDASANI